MNRIPTRPQFIDPNHPETLELYAVIQLLKEHYFEEPNLELAVKTLESLVFVLQHQEWIRFVLNHKDHKEYFDRIYENDRDKENKVFRTHNGQSFHLFENDFEVLQNQLRMFAEQITHQFEKIKTERQYVKIFIAKIQDSDVGCMEARLAPAVEYLAHPLLQKINDIFHQFLSELREKGISDANINQLFLNYLIDFFKDRLGDYIHDQKGSLVQLTWTHIRQYLVDVMGYKVEDFHNQFLLATQISPTTKKDGVNRRKYYCYSSKEDANRQLAIVKYLIGEAFPEVEQFANVEEILQFKDTPYRFRLNAMQEIALESARFPDRLIKTVRFDQFCYLDKFVTSMTHTAGKTTQPRGELRKEGTRKKFTVYGDGPIERSKKPAHYPYQNQKEKLHLFPLLSRPQSASLITQKALAPVFRWDKEASAVGVILDPEDALFNRMMTYDWGTIARPYDHDTLQEAEEFFNEKKRNKIYYSDYKSFRSRIEDRELIKNKQHNEVLVRIRWNKESSAVGIFTDTTESRYLAQFYARKIKDRLREQAKELKEAFDERYEVPIVYYIPGHPRNMTQYTKAEQQKDIQEANNIISDPMRIKEMIQKKSFHFMLLLEPAQTLKMIQGHNAQTVYCLPGELIYKNLIHIFDYWMPKPLLEELRQNFDANYHEDHFGALFIIACMSGDEKLLDQLLNKTQNIDVVKYYIPSLLSNVIKRGHTSIFNRLLSQFPDLVNTVCHGRNTLEHIACEFGRVDILKTLANLNPNFKNNLDQSNSEEKSPIDLALENEHREILKEVFGSKFSSGMNSEIWSSIVIKAMNKGWLDVLETYASKFSDHSKEYMKKSSEWFLIKAAESKNKELVLYLIEKMDLRSTNDPYRATALARACELGELEIAKLLISKGANIHLESGVGYQTALYAASKENHHEIVKYLLSKGADASLRSQNYETPLFLAAKKGYVATVREIVKSFDLPPLSVTLGKQEHDVKSETNIKERIVSYTELVNTTNDHDETPFHAAVFWGHLEVAQLIVEGFQQLHARFQLDFNAKKKLFIRACETNRLDMLRFLFSLLPSGIRIYDLDAALLLERACENNYVLIVEELLNRQVNLSQSRALSIALGCSNFKLAQMLVMHGDHLISIGAKEALNDLLLKVSNFTSEENKKSFFNFIETLLTQMGSQLQLKPESWETIVRLACEHDQYDLLEGLMKSNLSKSILFITARSPIMLAVDGKKVELLNHLLDLSFDINVVNRFKLSALTLAIKNKSENLVNLLVDRGANVNCEKSKPLQCAIESNDENITKLLTLRGAKLYLQENDPNRNALLMAAKLGKIDALRGMVEAIKKSHPQSPYGAIDLNAQDLVHEIRRAQLKEKLADYKSDRESAPEYKRSYTFFGRKFDFGHSKATKLAATEKLEIALSGNDNPALEEPGLEQGKLGALYRQYLKLR